MGNWYTSTWGQLVIILIFLPLGGWLLHQESQTWFISQPTIWPFVFMAVAVITAVFGSSVSQETFTSEQTQDVDRTLTWKPQLWITWGTATLLTLWILWRIPQLNNLSPYTAVTTSWILSMILGALGLIQLQKATNGNIKKLKTNLPIVLLLIILGLLLRLPQLDQVPFTLGGDEASQGLESVRFLNGYLSNPFTTGWLGVPSMSFIFNSLTISWWGQTIFALRLPWALVGCASILTTYFLTNRFGNRWLALGTTLMVATYHYHIHYSRLGSNQIADTLFVSLSLLFLIRALHGTSQNNLNWYGLGITAGLAYYFYAGARFTAVLVIAILLFEFIKSPKETWQKHRWGVVIMLVAFLITAAPMLQHANRFPNEFNARVNQVGIIQSGWLEREVEITGQSTTEILWDQFLRSALAFNYYPDRRVWYNPQTPLLDPIFGPLFLFGLGVGSLRLLTRSEDQQFAPMVAWWWGGVLLGGVLTESPPSSQRLITLAIPTCFFIALALQRLGQLIQKSVPRIPMYTPLLIGILGFGLYSPYFYFFEYTPQYLYGGSHAELATKLAPILTNTSEDPDLVFLGAPQMFWQFSTIPYLAQNVNGMDITQTITEPPPPAWHNGSNETIFVVLPDRLTELTQIKMAFPWGREYVIYSSGENESVLAHVYKLPPDN